MAGLARRITVRQVGPRGAGPQDPEDAIEHKAVLPPGAPSTVFPARQLGQEAPNEVALLIREVTGMARSGVGHPTRMDPWLISVPKLGLPSVRSTLRVLRE